MDVGDPLVKGSLVQEAAKRIRGLILTGELAPGIRLRQEDLSRALGVSRTPLRQAIALLVEEGFVDKTQTSQYTVASLDFESLLDLYRMRRELDGLASAQAADRRTPAQINALHEELHAMKESDPYGWLVHHQRFHLLVYEASHNIHLNRNRYSVLLSTRLFNPQLTARHTRRVESYQEQVAILQAIEAGDAAKAHTDARIHITNAMQVLVAGETGT